MKRVFIVGIISLFCLSLVGCSIHSSASESTDAIPFDATKAKVGDVIGEMKIVHIQDVIEDDQGLLTAYIDFKGEVTISGKFEHHEADAELIGAAVSFEPDEQSVRKIPQLKQANRVVWFLFSNYDEAAKQFGPPGSSGEATITIDNYKINFAPIATWDTAELKEVKQLTVESK